MTRSGLEEGEDRTESRSGTFCAGRSTAIDIGVPGSRAWKQELSPLFFSTLRAQFLRVPTRTNFKQLACLADPRRGTPRRTRESGRPGGKLMLGDILIALVITAVAIVLGVVVHPILFFLVVLAVVYLFARVRSCH